MIGCLEREGEQSGLLIERSKQRAVGSGQTGDFFCLLPTAFRLLLSISNAFLLRPASAGDFRVGNKSGFGMIGIDW